MTPRAGLLMFRKQKVEIESADTLEVLLVHPGGPFYTKKDVGVWSIPKGIAEDGESLLQTAQREFKEETGFEITPPFIELGENITKSGKVVHVWAFEGDCDLAAFTSNTFMMEWPPRSGSQKEFPENDRAAFFTLAEARVKIYPSLLPFLDRLEEALGSKHQ